MTATLALVLSVAALLLSVFQASLWLARRSRTTSTSSQRVLVSGDALLDQRSCLQAALRTVQSQLESPSPESSRAATRIVRLLLGSPLLVASPIISDAELTRIERDIEAKIVWLITNNESIEFAYPALSGGFSAVVIENLARGVCYRYLVPDSERSRRRRDAIAADYPEIEVRFLDPAYWNYLERTVDAYNVYDPGDAHRRDEATGYYKYPGSVPRRWIKMDRESVYLRLRDVEAQWELSD